MTDEQAVAPTETASAEPAQLENVTVGHESAIYEPSQVRVEWQDVTPGEDTTLADPVTTVALANGSDEDATLVLRLVGDYGTTRTEYLELGETDVAAGATVVVPVDLSALYAGKTMTYAGRAHVSAKVMVEGVEAEQVVGDELFYHRVLEGVALYDEVRLIAAHAAGDVSNLAPEAFLSEDPEDQALVRIVAFEPAEGKSPEEDFGMLSEEPVNQQEPPKLVTSGSASGGFQQKVCVRFAVQTADSGFQSSTGVTEDVWPTANNGEEHTANYVRVRVDGKALTTNSSGCATFNTTWFGGTRDVRVWARAQRGNGTYVRVHSGAANSTASYPGITRLVGETRLPQRNQHGRINVESAMLKPAPFTTLLGMVVVFGCTNRASMTDVGESVAATDNADTTAATVGPTDSAGTSAPGNTSAPLGTGTTTSGSTGTTSTSSQESSTGTPIDPCRPGVGVDWPRHGAFLTLANEEDFTEGPLELACSIDRALEPGELEPGTVAAVELTCQLPDESGSSTVYVAATIPEAVAGLEALVGLQDVTVVFNYGAGSLKAFWTEAVVFGIRDDVGPLLISQWNSCEGEIRPTGNACSIFAPPSWVDPGWSDPLPEARLADVDCGTRAWEWNYSPAMGTLFDMTRLALRFETDDGFVDVLDHHMAPLNLEGEVYEVFSTDVVGEVEDPGVIYGQRGYTHFISFIIIRTP